MTIMTDWPLGKFLTVVMAVQVAMLGIVGLGSLGLDIPIIRQVVGFVFLVFTPGILILRLLKANGLKTIEVLLYSVGLSLTFVMVLGLLLNILYPIIPRPISSFPIVVSIFIVSTALCIITVKKESGGTKHAMGDFKRSEWKSEITSPQALFLISLPFLSVLGTFVFNFWDSNVVLIALLAVLSTVPILVALNWLPKRLYPFAILSIAISLLFHGSLLSQYLVEWADSSWEYYFSSLVVTNSFWNWTTSINFNSALSVVLIAPTFAQVCKLDLMWVFKIVYPTLFALVPVGIYAFVERQTTAKIAFLSSFFFMSFFAFYTTALGLARFQIAALFLILILLLTIGRKLDGKRAVLAILFCFSLVVSHYALSSIMILIFAGALFWFVLRYGKPVENSILSPVFVLLFVILSFTWAVYVTSGSILESLALIGNTIQRDFLTGFLNPKMTPGLNVLVGETSVPLHQLTKYVNLIAQLFIAVGIVAALLNWRQQRKLGQEFLALSVMSFALLVAGLIVPQFAVAIDTTRLFQVNLLFLSPFCILGGVAIVRMASEIFGRSLRKKINSSTGKDYIWPLFIFFAIYLLVNSGFVYELVGQPINVPISLREVWQPNFTEYDVSAVTWLKDKVANGTEIYSDLNGAYLLMMFTGVFSPFQGNTDIVNYVAGSYIFLGRECVETQKIRLEDPYPPMSRELSRVAPIQNLTIYEALQVGDRFYDNGYGQVTLTRKP